MTMWVMQCDWYQWQCHLMPIASLYSLGQHDRNEVQHDFSCHVTPVALLLASHDALNILNVTITFPRPIQSKIDVAWLFDHVTQMPLALASQDAIGVGAT